MLNKITIIFLCSFFLLSSLKAHKIPGMDLSVEHTINNQIIIKGFNKRANKGLHGNKIKLYSTINNSVIFEGFLNQGTLITKVPKVPYSIFMFVGDNDVVIEGIAPKNGFSGIYASKTNRAFNLMLYLNLLLLILSVVFIIKRYRY